MVKTLATLLLLLASAGFAQISDGTSNTIEIGEQSAPEIDASASAGALALLSGALLVVRAGRKK